MFAEDQCLRAWYLMIKLIRIMMHLQDIFKLTQQQQELAEADL